MKKTLFIIGLLLVIFGSLYIADHIRVSEISPETAIETVKKGFNEKSIATITNFDNPKVEEVIFKTKPSIYLFDDKTSIVGKKLYKITFNTTMDGLLGPMVFYVDKSSGDLIGADFRE